MGLGAQILLEWCAMELIELAVLHVGSRAFHGIRARVGSAQRSAQTESLPEFPATEKLHPLPLSPVHRVSVISATPGRARINVMGLRGNEEMKTALLAALRGLPGVTSATASTLTANVLVHHRDSIVVDEIRQTIEVLAGFAVVPNVPAKSSFLVS